MSGLNHDNNNIDQINSYRKRKISLAVIVISILFFIYPHHINANQFTSFSVNLSFADPIIILISVLWIVGLLGDRQIPKFTFPIIFFIILVFLSLFVGNINSENYFSIESGVIEVIKLFGGIAWMFSIFFVARERPSFILPIGATVSIIVAFAFALLTIYLTFIGESRPSGPFQNPNIYANYLLLNICFTGYVAHTWISESSKRIQQILLPIAGVLVLGLFQTGSRGAIIGLLVAAGFIFFFWLRQNLREVTIGSILVISIAGLAGIINSYFDILYLSDRLEKGVEDRFTTWSVAFEAFQSNPVFGIGYGQFPQYLPYGSFGVHNTYLSLLTELGIFIAVYFVALLLLIISHTFKLATTNICLIFIGAAIVGTMGQGIGADIDNFRSFWIAIGIITAYHHSHTKIKI